MENWIKNIFLVVFCIVGIVFGQERIVSVETPDDKDVVVSLDEEGQVEQLILDAFAGPEGYVELLNEALELTDKISSRKADFFRVYILQSRFRIAASQISSRMLSGEEGAEISLQARLVAKELDNSAVMMEGVKEELNENLEKIKMYNRKQRGRVLSLINRCDYCNAWVYYSISTIVNNGLKERYIGESERVFTSFLSKKYQAVNLPVMVNCMYGKGLCLRDSGRYYDLLVMLDTMSVSDSDAVKFARLRLAASVKLSLSVEILRVVQEYFGDDAITKKLDGEELEMLVNCIEAGVKLLDRDLPVKMKMSLRNQLVKAVERTEGYGKYWQERVSGLVGEIELKSPYVKLLQAYEASNEQGEMDYERILELADEGLELCDDGHYEKKSELLYLKVVSSWNSQKYMEALGSAADFLEEFPDNVHNEQVAGITCQVIMKLVSLEQNQLENVNVFLEELIEKKLISDEEYLWTSGCVRINSGKYKEGYDFFCREDVVNVLPVKRHYGILLAILPMLKGGQISEEQAVDSILECCGVFVSSNGHFVQSNHFVEAATIICEIAEELLKKEQYELADKVLGVIDELPHIRGDIYNKYMGVNLTYQLAMGSMLDEYLDEIASKNLHNDPVIFNLLVSESRKLETNGGGHAKLLIRVYRLLLSSNLLDENNAVAVRLYLGRCYFKEKRYRSYLNLAETIASHYPMHATVTFYRQMAVSYREEGEYAKSAEYWNIVLQNSIETKEAWKEALYNKILCYNMAGDRAKARQTLELAILRKPELISDESYGEMFGALRQEIMNK